MTARKTETANPSVTVEFEFEKDTPGTVRFKEVVPEDDVARVRTFYLQKFCATKELSNPKKLRLTIEAIG
jgi:hypothetical protein